MPTQEERPELGPGESEIAHTLGAIHDHLRRLELMVGPELARARPLQRELVPAWRRVSEGEQRLPMAAAVAVAIGLQILLPRNYTIDPHWLLPSLEGALGAGLLIANPRRINRTSNVLRGASVLLIALISLANAWSSAILIDDLLHGRNSDNATVLLSRGASIYVTNILVFALWYWEWDRGGPVARALAERAHPDFLFPQMGQPELAPSDWVPTFADYLYLSFTNATAFSPTDTMPLARWAKLLMLVQASVALVTVGLVIARAVNVLK